METVSTPAETEVEWAWFPLVPRPRPAALPLDARVAKLTALAGLVGDDGPPARAAEVCGKAALLASDCGLPDLVRELCWRQWDALTSRGPLPGPLAELAVEPLLTIARQLVNDEGPDDAYAMLEELCRAARERATIEIDGHPVDMDRLTAAPGARKAVRARLWTALLADGTRALAAAGRWQDAVAQAAAHRGIGTRLLDGRQVAVIAALHNGKPDQALAIAGDSAIEEEWEMPVLHLLRVACRRAAGEDCGPHVPAMLASALSLAMERHAGSSLFATRVGITALDLAQGAAGVLQLGDTLAKTGARDAHAARDVLARKELVSAITSAQRKRLEDVVRASGLGAGGMPGPALQVLRSSAERAEHFLRFRSGALSC